MRAAAARGGVGVVRLVPARHRGDLPYPRSQGLLPERSVLEDDVRDAPFEGELRLVTLRAEAGIPAPSRAKGSFSMPSTRWSC